MPGNAETADVLAALIAGTPGSAHAVTSAAATSAEPALLVAAAVLGRAPELADRAARAAQTERDRQLAAIAAAYAAGDGDRVDLLVRDHLSEHPDSLLAAWIAGRNDRSTTR